MIGSIIAGPTAKTFVPLPRGQVGFLVYSQVSLVIGGIIAGLTAKMLVPRLRGQVGFSGVWSGCPCDRWHNRSAHSENACPASPGPDVFLMYCQVALAIGGIIAVFTVKTLVNSAVGLSGV